MILYHGTNIVFDKIDLSKCRPNKDFGQGFYTTVLYDQAEKMAHRVTNIYGGCPVVLKFELNEAYLSSKNIKFKDFGNSANKEWAEFVMNNRNINFNDINSDKCNKDCKYDIVTGPIADDDMAVLFRQYENKFISFDMLVSGLIYRKMTNQYSFHSEKACNLLHLIEAIKL